MIVSSKSDGFRVLDRNFFVLVFRFTAYFWARTVFTFSATSNHRKWENKQFGRKSTFHLSNDPKLVPLPYPKFCRNDEKVRFICRSNWNQTLTFKFSNKRNVKVTTPPLQTWWWIGLIESILICMLIIENYWPYLIRKFNKIRVKIYTKIIDLI